MLLMLKWCISERKTIRHSLKKRQQDCKSCAN
jgi:hypothetical protein